MINMGQIRREYERAQNGLRDAKSEKAQKYHEGKVIAYWDCLNQLKNEEKSLDDYEFDLTKSMNVLRIFRTFLCCHPDEIQMGSGCFSDPDDSTGEGLHKMIDDVLIAYDGFMTKYEQENATPASI